MINSGKRIIIDGANGFLGKSIFNHFNKKNNFELFKLTRELNCNFDDRNKYILIIATGLFNGSITELVNSNIMRPLEVLTKLDKVISKVILLSSGAVYGSQLKDPRSKENDILKSCDLYSASKNSIESLIKLYLKGLKIPLTILRLPIIYSGNNLRGVLPSMLSSYSKKRIIKVYSSGKSVRDFLHIDDFLLALNNIIKYDIEGIYNISSDATYSMFELANMIVKQKSEIIVSNKEPNALEKLSLDYSKAYNDFYYEPKFNSLKILDLFEMYGLTK